MRAGLDAAGGAEDVLYRVAHVAHVREPTAGGQSELVGGEEQMETFGGTSGGSQGGQGGQGRTGMAHRQGR